MHFRERQVTVLGRKRKEYHDLVAEYCYHLQDIRSEEEVMSHFLRHTYWPMGMRRLERCVKWWSMFPGQPPGFKFFRRNACRSPWSTFSMSGASGHTFDTLGSFLVHQVEFDAGIRQAVTFRESTIWSLLFSLSFSLSIVKVPSNLGMSHIFHRYAEKLRLTLTICVLCRKHC